MRTWSSSGLRAEGRTAMEGERRQGGREGRKGLRLGCNVAARP